MTGWNATSPDSVRRGDFLFGVLRLITLHSWGQLGVGGGNQRRQKADPAMRTEGTQTLGAGDDNLI